MDDAEIDRPGDLRVRHSWARPGRRLRPRLTIDVDAEVAAVVTDRDGRLLLAVAENDGQLQLWDPATGEPVAGPSLTGPATWASARSTPSGR
ncbi:hypothetical protein [Actinoplanes sp. NPDC020271]|uniref:hypothetical protein n=1 Tax=Actinoplanes sp. NPDC020271 TaxID=3363896 RepID=UPI0037984211